MSMTSKALTGLAAIALAAVLFFVLRGDSEDSGGSTPAKEAAAPAGEAAKDNSKRSGREGGNAEGEKKSAGGGAQAPGSADEVATIVVKGGEPVGGVAELSFAKGEAIRFRVESDVAEEIHMHGYDVSKDVSAGGEVLFDVPASIEGIFEVELEHSVVPIAEITVNPS